MALVDATAEVQSCGGSLAAVARETAPNSNLEFERQHAVGFPILNDATGAVARSFGIGWTEVYLQSLYDQFVVDRTGDPPEPSWIEPMQARYVIAQDGTNCLRRHPCRLSGGTRTNWYAGGATSPLDGPKRT
jgi:peroxiredoxin